MKKQVSLMAFLCLLILTCCQQGNKLPESYKTDVCNELSQMTVKFFDAWVKEDLDSCMSFLASDFINMWSSESTANYEQSRESNKNLFDNFIVKDVKYERTECVVDKDMAFEIGVFEQTLISNDGKDTIPNKVRGMTVFKKQEDGSWKQFRLIAQQ
jgi:ketosteroid isomerase-like protein